MERVFYWLGALLMVGAVFLSAGQIFFQDFRAGAAVGCLSFSFLFVLCVFLYFHPEIDEWVLFRRKTPAKMNEQELLSRKRFLYFSECFLLLACFACIGSIVSAKTDDADRGLEKVYGTVSEEQWYPTGFKTRSHHAIRLEEYPDISFTSYSQLPVDKGDYVSLSILSQQYRRFILRESHILPWQKISPMWVYYYNDFTPCMTSFHDHSIVGELLCLLLAIGLLICLPFKYGYSSNRQDPASKQKHYDPYHPRKWKK